MENEFDRTLTQRAQNSYAEGMAGDPHSPEFSEDIPVVSPDTSKTDVYRTGAQMRKEPTPESLTGEGFIPDEIRRDQLGLLQRNPDLEDRIPNEPQEERLTPQQAIRRAMDVLNDSRAPEDVKREAFNMIRGQARFLFPKDTDLPREIKILMNTDSEDLSADQLKSLVNQAEGMGLSKTLSREIVQKQREASKAQEEAQLDYYFPPSAEDLAEKLLLMEGPEWQPGGEREIVMRDGTVHWGNLLDWARERWLKWGHQFDPDNPQASAWGTVGFLSGISFIDLQTWVKQDRYWRKRVYDEETGKYTYSSSPEYENFRQAFINEMFRFSKAHEHDVTVRLARGAEKKMIGEALPAVMSQTIWMKDKDGLLAMWKLSASDEVIKEGPNKGMFKWMLVEGSNGPIEEGNLGRAHRQADYLYFKMAHIENVGDQNNAFHEALGEKGRMEFYRSMVQRTLMRMYGKEPSVVTVLEKVKGSGMKGINLTEIMFCRSEEDMTDLLTRQTTVNDAELLKFLNRARKPEDKMSPEDTQRFQQEKAAFMKALIREAVTMRRQLLEKLTGMGDDGRPVTGEPGQIAFRSKAVWDLFNSMRPNPPNDPNPSLDEMKMMRDWTKMQHLGLRFMDLIIQNPPGQQGDKWNKDPDAARKEVQKALNLFKRGFNKAPWISTVRGAIQDAVGEVNNLPGFDAEYAENFAYSKVYFMLSSGLNDTTATGTDASTKLLQFMGYRLNNLLTGGGKNFVGSMQNIRGMKRLLLTPWEGLYGEQTDPVTGKVKKVSLAKVMEHGLTDETRGQKMLEVDAAQGVEVTYAANHVTSALKVFDMVMAGPIFDFEKWIKLDLYNRVSIDPKAMNHIMNEINKSIRYTYNQIGIDFEEIDDDSFEIDFTREIGKTTYGPKLTFGRKKMKDKLFDNEVINMGMYERRMFEGRWVNGIIGQKDINGEDMLSEYSRNIIFYLLAKEILEHELYDPEDSMYNSSIWGKTMVNAIEGLFASIPIELETTTVGFFNKYTRIKKRDGFANRKEFDKIRKMGNAGRLKLQLEDIRAQLAESTWKGGQGTTKRFFSYIFQDLWTFK